MLEGTHSPSPRSVEPDPSSAPIGGERRRLVGSALLLALLTAAVATTAVAPRFGYLQRAALWGVVLLVSFAGWGSLIARIASPARAIDLGLRLAWGMGGVIAVGGVLCLLSLATRPMLLTVTVVGIGLQCGTLALRRSVGRWRWPAVGWGRLGIVAAFGVTAILAAIQYYAGAAGAGLTPDDTVVYLAFPRKILATGSLLEPFSMRRLNAYGGQSLLHALSQLGSGNVLQVPLLDMSVCLVIVLALVIGNPTPAAFAMTTWLLVLLVVTLPNLHVNSTSVLSGLVLFLALFRTAWAPALCTRHKRRAAVLGMLAGSAATLRLSYGPPAAAFLAILYAPAAVHAVRRHRPLWRWLGAPVTAAAAMGLTLLPWALLSYRSNGTPLFPLFDGYYHAEYGRMTSAPLSYRVSFLGFNLRNVLEIPGWPLFIVTALLVPWRSTSGALTALTWASLIGFGSVVWGFPTSDNFNVLRYYFAFVSATVIAVSMYAASKPWADWRTVSKRDRLIGGLIAIAIAWYVLGSAVPIYLTHLNLASRIRLATREPSSLAERDKPYRSLQDRIPPGAAILTMLDEPFWLDFQRNRIDLLDLPGQVSPPPGIPLDDDDAFVRYLMGLGYRYVAFVRPRSSLWFYQRSKWEALVGPSAPLLWRYAAPLYLKLFDRFESLETSRVRLYDDGKIVALDLAQLVPG